VAPERLPSIPSIGMCVIWIIWLGNALLYTNIKKRQFVIGGPILNSLWYIPSTYTLFFKEYGLWPMGNCNVKKFHSLETHKKSMKYTAKMKEIHL